MKMYHKNTVLPLDVPVLQPLGDYNSLPELLIEKANYFANLGKDYYAIDAVTHEVRLFSKFDEETRRIASAFYKLGLRKGDMVIFMPTEAIKLHIFLTGVWRANGVCRASYPEDNEATLRQRLEEGECKFVVCDSEGIATCKEAIIGLPWSVEIIVMEKHNELKSLQQFLEEDDGQDCPALDVGKEDPALILCTSGTTGPSKGAVHTHGALIQQAYLLSLLPFTESKPNLMFSKGTHISGSTFPFSLLITGKTSIVSGKITKEIILKAVHELKPGFASAFPTFLLALVGPDAKNYDRSSLEIICTGGTTITPATREALFQLPNLKDFINTFGATENMITTTSAILSSESELERSSKPKSIRDLPDFSTGTTYPETYIQVRDIETLEVLGPHKSGEICVKSPTTFKEYYLNPEATKVAFVEGFFRTGDLGHYDEHGYIYIDGRLKEIFKYFNNHISPSELEGVIGKHSNVSEVCVVGTPDPNGGGDVPRAFVTLKEDSAPEIAEEIRKFANEQLPNYKHLRGGVYIIPEMPKGKTGKVTRRLVADLRP